MDTLFGITGRTGITGTSCPQRILGSFDIWSDTSWSLSWRLASWCSYNGRIIYSSYNERIILLVVLLYVVPTECTDHTEAYGLKLFESTEWPTLRDARIHRNECLLVCALWWTTSKEIQVQEPFAMLNLGDATQAINSAFYVKIQMFWPLFSF